MRRVILLLWILFYIYLLVYTRGHQIHMGSIILNHNNYNGLYISTYYSEIYKLCRLWWIWGFTCSENLLLSSIIAIVDEWKYWALTRQQRSRTLISFGFLCHGLFFAYHSAASLHISPFLLYYHKNSNDHFNNSYYHYYYHSFYYNDDDSYYSDKIITCGQSIQAWNIGSLFSHCNRI